MNYSLVRWLKKKLKQCCKKKSTVDPAEKIEMKKIPPTDDQEELKKQKSKFLQTEAMKAPLKTEDFTLNEYTEKIIQYGLITVSNDWCNKFQTCPPELSDTITT